nr:hypothetical protein [Frigoriglobus tundricola]
MEIDNLAVLVAVLEKIGVRSLFLLARGGRLADPRGPCHVQVAADHCGRAELLGPLPTPEFRALRFRRQPGAQLGNEIGVKWNLIAPAVLRVRGFDGHGRGLGVESERAGCQARQFGSAQTGHAGNKVEHRAIRTGQPSVVPAGAGRVEQSGGFVSRQRSPDVTNGYLDVPLRREAEGVLGQLARHHEPRTERLECGDVVVGCLYRDAAVLLRFSSALG